MQSTCFMTYKGARVYRVEGDPGLYAQTSTETVYRRACSGQGLKSFITRVLVKGPVS